MGGKYPMSATQKNNKNGTKLEQEHTTTSRKRCEDQWLNYTRFVFCSFGMTYVVYGCSHREVCSIDRKSNVMPRKTTTTTAAMRITTKWQCGRNAYMEYVYIDSYRGRSISRAALCCRREQMRRGKR